MRNYLIVGILFFSASAYSLNFNDKTFFGSFGFHEKFDLLTSSQRTFDLNATIQLDYLEISSSFSVKGAYKFAFLDIMGHLNTNPNGMIQPYFNVGIGLKLYSSCSTCFNGAVTPVIDIGLQLGNAGRGFYIRFFHKSRIFLTGYQKGVGNTTFFGLGKRL